MKNKISVMMSVYEEEIPLVKRAVESILTQSYTNFELIIILDNPDYKDMIDYLNDIGDKRVRVFVNEKNIGLPESLNRAIAYSSGDYLARMDADDISCRDRLEKQMNYLKKGGYDLVGCDVNFVNNEKIIKTLRLPRNQESILKYMRYASPILHATWLARKSVYEKNKGYRNVFSVEDLDFLIRCALNGMKMSNFDGVLYTVRMTEVSISRSNPGIQETLAAYLRRCYRRGSSPSIDEMNQYTDSIKYKKAVNRYKKYYAIKIKRSKMKKENILWYIGYTFLLVFHLRTFLKDLNEKAHCKLILYDERNSIR